MTPDQEQAIRAGLDKRLPAAMATKHPEGCESIHTDCALRLVLAALGRVRRERREWEQVAKDWSGR